MKQNRSVYIAFGLLILVASLYRVWDGRPWGFAPQIAMALFAGAMIKNKKLAFVLPIASMFLSDAIYQVLYINGLSPIQGFYNGQVVNYLLFASLTFFGFWIHRINWIKIAAASIMAPTAYFIVSNFAVWLGGGSLGHPKTFAGLMMTLGDGVPFYRGSVEATVVFSVILFGGYYLINRLATAQKTQLA